MDRHFHALAIWEELLLRPDLDTVISYHREFSHRWDTIRRIGDYYRSSPEARAEFGSLNIMIPKRVLVHEYAFEWVPNGIGGLIPVSRPVTIRAD